MNPLLTTKQETFRAGTDKLEFFRERLLKMNNGALMFCTRGEANITIDLRKSLIPQHYYKIFFLST
ncbi:hypothetical protein [Bacteroides uniformis]|uniref:hypothetical protein n=1 Tax=Bacteroides uniformis TaxID=820 RepID=UPI00321AFCC2